MAVGVGEIANLVDHQQLRASIVAQASAQGRIAVECAEIAKQLACAGEQYRVTVDQRLVGDVLRQRRLADAVRADRRRWWHEEVERHQRVDGGAVAALRPIPVEVQSGLKRDIGCLQ